MSHGRPKKPNGHGPPRLPTDHVASLFITTSTQLWCYLEGRNWLVEFGGFAEGAAGPVFQPSRLRILPMGADLAPVELTLSIFAETYRKGARQEPPKAAKMAGIDDQVDAVGMDFDRIVSMGFVADEHRYMLQIGDLQAGPDGRPQLVADLMVLRPAVEGGTTHVLMRLGDFATLYRVRTGARIVLPPA